MPSDPNELWPKRSDAASEGVDENRAIDDIDMTLVDDLPIEEEEDEVWAGDADERPVDLDDDDRSLEVEVEVENDELEH